MASRRERQMVSHYTLIMEEVKTRLYAIDFVVCGETRLPAPLANEFCYLQLRLICELIALGCLTAHGDIPGIQTKRIRKAYSADKIMSMMESLHPRYYPNPIQFTERVGKTVRMIDAQPGFIEKDEFLSLYRKCGEALHRGTIEKLAAPRVVEVWNFDSIIEYAGAISKLISAHTMLSLDESRVFICQLNAAGPVQVNLGRTPER